MRLPANRCALPKGTPRRLLTVVDLPQIQDVTLYNAPAGAAPVLDDAPGAMVLAVLAANLGA
jgi:hypothetical protein